MQGSRWFFIPAAALLLVLAMFLLMYWMILPPAGESGPPQRVLEGIKVAPPRQEQPPDPLTQLESAPPPPPMAPPALARPDLPAMNMPALAMTPVTTGSISVPLNLGGGMSLAGSGAFGGFAGGGRGNGSGSGGSGVGGGKGFTGKPLIPLSTARPQMPEWACKQKIRGWVEAVFTVMPNGRVQDVKIIDADPRGVYEAAAIESISNWIYESTGKAREVKQRVPMDPADCAYNWQ